MGFFLLAFPTAAQARCEVELNAFNLGGGGQQVHVLSCDSMEDRDMPRAFALMEARGRIERAVLSSNDLLDIRTGQRAPGATFFVRTVSR